MISVFFFSIKFCANYYSVETFFIIMDSCLVVHGLVELVVCNVWDWPSLVNSSVFQKFLHVICLPVAQRKLSASPVSSPPTPGTTLIKKEKKKKRKKKELEEPEGMEVVEEEAKVSMCTFLLMLQTWFHLNVHLTQCRWF